MAGNPVGTGCERLLKHVVNGGDWAIAEIRNRSNGLVSDVVESKDNYSLALRKVSAFGVISASKAVNGGYSD